MPVTQINGKLTTHVLDTSRGLPGADIAVSLFQITGSNREAMISTRTNDDGRCDSPLLEGVDFVEGVYELEFEVGDYFAGQASKSGNAAGNAADAGKPRFLDRVVLRFGIDSPDEHYHVPLLVSPFSYSTYRGS